MRHSIKHATIILYNLKSWQFWFVKTSLEAKANRPVNQPDAGAVCCPGRLAVCSPANPALSFDFVLLHTSE